MKKQKGIISLLLAAVLLLLIKTAVFAETDVNAVMTKESFTAQNGTVLPYRIYVPDDYDANKEYSFMLFLHGAGNRGNDNENQISQNVGIISRIIGGETVQYNGKTVDLSREFIIVAPQCANEAQWVDTPWGKSPDPSYSLDEIPQSKTMEAVVGLLDEIKENYNIDNSRMYITGLSMGGFGTWDLLMRYPDMFAAAIPMGGAGDLSKAEDIKDIPIWTFHQMLDTVVLSQGTQNMVSKLINCGGNIKFTPYFELQHNAWTKGYAEKDLLQWLYSHKKTSVKVACVGDSITEGAGLANPETESYPAVLQKLLGNDFTVRNFGKSACSALKTAVHPYTETEEYADSLEFAPDVVFIMLGTNDIKTENWTEGSVNFEKDYEDIINSYRKVNPAVKVYVGIPPRIFKDNVYGERSTSVLEEEGIPKIYSLSENIGANTVDLFSATVNKPELFPDFLHPNAEGSEILALTIADSMSGLKASNKDQISVLEGASDWAKSELGLAYAIGLMPDSVTGLYQNSITREQFCETVTAMFEKTEYTEKALPFTDTQNDSVRKAYSLGIVSGVSDTEFVPDKSITREEISAMLCRAFKIIAPDAVATDEISFADASAISEWAMENVKFIAGEKIMLGDENGNINPQSNTTREQAILLVYRTFCRANSYPNLQ